MLSEALRAVGLALGGSTPAAALEITNGKVRAERARSALGFDNGGR